jgi:hypothetical protein
MMMSFLDKFVPGIEKMNKLTPISSTNILSKPTGPRELLTILAMEAAARTTSIKVRRSGN